MPIRIQAPDGTIAEFPDGTSDATITGVMAKEYPPPKAAAPKPNVAKDIGLSYGTGVKQGALAIADQVAGAVPGLSVIHRAASDLWSAAHGQAPTANGNIFSDIGSAVIPDHAPQTWQGRTALTAGQMTPAAFGGEGSAIARGANVFVPTAVSSAAGETARALGASPKVERAVRMGGAVVGGAAASARLTPKAAPSTDEAVGNIFATRAKADPEAMAAKAADMRASGVQPTLLDVSGTQGQRLTKAVGITSPDAGETLQQNANMVTADTKPAAMAQTRKLTGEGRTADQLAKDLAETRSTEAETTYAGPYAAPVQLNDRNVIQALRDPEGAAAINRAIAGARSRMDYKAVADLQQLKNTASGPTGDTQVWPTTGRALDRVQIAFGNRAAQLAQNGSKDIASGLKMRQGLINGLLDNVEGLGPARAAYKAKSQALDILNGDGKDPFSTDPTDYSTWLKSLSPEAQHANQVSIRQNILDTLGGQRAGTMGTLDNLTSSAYAKQNLGAALGPKEAGDYLANLTSRLSQKRNATQVSPSAGSPTAMLQNDTSGLDKALSLADTAVKVKTGNVLGLAGKLSAHLRTMGISDAQAQELAKASVDPARVDAVIAAIRRSKGPGAAQSFINFRGGLLGAARKTYPVGGQLPPPQPAPQ